MLFKPYQIKIRNFMSFGNNETTIGLDLESPTLIVGRNMDSAVDGQVDSNGSGKTTILNSIIYVLYDTVISDKSVNADELINNINKKDLYVSIVFSVGTDKFYKVERYRKNKAFGGNGVRLYERVGGTWTDEFDESHDITPDSISNADKKIAEILGMKFELFSRIVAFSATHKPFLFLGPADQIEIVEDICGLRELTERADEIKKKNKLDKVELERLESVNSTIKSQRSQIEDQITSAKVKAAAWDSATASDLAAKVDELAVVNSDNIDFDEQLEFIEYINASNAKILTYENTIKSLNGEIQTIESSVQRRDKWERTQKELLDRANSVLEKIDDVDIDSVIEAIEKVAEVRKSLAAIQSEIKAVEKVVDTNSGTLTKKREELAHLQDATCPYCSQSYAGAKKKAVSVLDEIEELQAAVNADLLIIDSLDLKVVEHHTLISDLTSKLVFTTQREAMEHKSKFDATKKEIARLESEVNPHSISDAEAEKEIDEIEQELEHYRGLIAKRKRGIADANNVVKFNSVKELMDARNKADVLEAEIQRLTNATNPLLSVVASLESIKLEDTKDAEIEELTTLVEHQQFLVKLLTKKDSFIRKALLYKSIPFLNTRLRYYLEKIGFLHRVEFQEDLSVKISRFGNPISFVILSSGQKARVNLALSFAFRDMLQARHGKLGFCILDECLDVGLGNVGVQLAAKMIKSVAAEEKLSMFVISHRDEIQNMFDERMVVEIDGGFSTIKTE